MTGCRVMWRIRAHRRRRPTCRPRNKCPAHKAVCLVAIPQHLSLAQRARARHDALVGQMRIDVRKDRLGQPLQFQQMTYVQDRGLVRKPRTLDQMCNEERKEIERIETVLASTKMFQPRHFGSIGAGTYGCRSRISIYDLQAMRPTSAEKIIYLFHTVRIFSGAQRLCRVARNSRKPLETNGTSSRKPEGWLLS